jgi:hypothetical protein
LYYREVRQKNQTSTIEEIPPVILKYRFMGFKQILGFRVQIIRKYIMVVNVPLHCIVQWQARRFHTTSLAL